MSVVTGKPVPPMLARLGHPPTGERWEVELFDASIEGNVLCVSGLGFQIPRKLAEGWTR